MSNIIKTETETEHLNKINLPEHLSEHLCLDKKLFSVVNTKENIYVVRIQLYDDINYVSFIMSNNKKMRIDKCPGCYPLFHQNQEAHIGKNGCLGDYCDNLFNN